MNGWVQKFYEASPIVLQHTLTTVYGACLQRRRYGGCQQAAMGRLRSSQYESSKTLEELQFASFKAILAHAYEYVEFYEKTWRERGIHPNDIKGPNDILRLPIVTKEDIRANPEQFVSKAYRRSSLVPIHTSGTTGTPLTLWMASDAIQKNYAFFARALEWAGVRVGDRSSTFAGRTLIPGRQKGPPYWRYNLCNNNLLFSSYHISDETVPAYLRKLSQWDPVFIDSYPSSIYAIARHCLETESAHRVSPRAIITSSETLLEYQRETVEQAFGCRVFDQYGAAEMAAFISQCEYGAYHVHPEYAVVEILQGGRPVMPGEAGELICTGLLNYAMPLIRYRIGDTATASDQSCACGRNFPLIGSLTGRTDDILTTSDGRRIGRLDPVFKGLHTIKETQIVQRSFTNVLLKIVKGEGFRNEEIDILIGELRKRLGEEMTFDVEYLEQIPKTSAGKFRSVVSMIGQARADGIHETDSETAPGRPVKP